MKTAYTLVLAVVLTGCVAPHSTEADYTSRYRAWRASVENELAAGKSWVRGDKDALAYLGKHAGNHVLAT